MRRRIHACHMRRRIHACHMRRRIHEVPVPFKPALSFIPALSFPPPLVPLPVDTFVVLYASSPVLLLPFHSPCVPIVLVGLITCILGLF